MQNTSFQSAPCASPDAAAASAAAMAALAAPKGMEHRIVSTVMQEVNGMWIAVVSVEIVELDAEAAPEEQNEEKSQDEPVFGEDDTPDNIYFLAGFNSRQMEEFQPFPEVDANPEPIMDESGQIPLIPDHDQSAHAAPYYGDSSGLQDTQTGPETLMGDAPQLAEQLKSDFNDEPMAAPIPSEDLTVAEPAPDQTEDDEEGEGDGGDSERQRQRELAENPHVLTAEEIAPAPST